MILFPVFAENRFLGRIQGKAAQVHRVRTHICDESRFVKSLSNHHRLRNGKAELARRFLLQRRSREGRSWRFFQRLFTDIVDDKFRTCFPACFQKPVDLILVFQASVQFRFQERFSVGQDESGDDPVRGFGHEVVHFAFTLYDQAHGYRLHPSGR